MSEIRTDNGEVLSMAEVSKLIADVKQKLSAGDFGSIVPKYKTADLAIEYILGLQQRFSPRVEGVSVEQKMQWVTEILAIIAELPNRTSTESILGDDEIAHSPVEITKRIVHTLTSLGERPATTPQPSDQADADGIPHFRE